MIALASRLSINRHQYAFTKTKYRSRFDKIDNDKIRISLLLWSNLSSRTLSRSHMITCQVSWPVLIQKPIIVAFYKPRKELKTEPRSLVTLAWLEMPRNRSYFQDRCHCYFSPALLSWRSSCWMCWNQSMKSCQQKNQLWFYQQWIFSERCARHLRTLNHVFTNCLPSFKIHSLPSKRLSMPIWPVIYLIPSHRLRQPCFCVRYPMPMWTDRIKHHRRRQSKWMIEMWPQRC